MLCENIMGQRTVYYISNSYKSFEEQFLDDFSSFRKWILDKHAESILEFQERLISPAIEKCLKNENFDLSLVEKEVYDELTFEYLLTYCDLGEGKDKIELVGPMMSSWRYNESHKYIESVNDREL